MQIGSTENDYSSTMVYQTHPSNKIKEQQFELVSSDKEIEETSSTGEYIFHESYNLSKYNSSSALDYYNFLCKEFPDISFRLDDENSQDETSYHLGYQNSMNQRGKNFSYPGQCSIKIDVAVIKHMQQDPKYADHIIGSIKNTKIEYGLFERMGREEGLPYICRNFTEVNGDLQLSITCAGYPFSTEEEVREMHKNDHDTEASMNKYEQMKKELLDHYLEMLQKSNAKKSILEINKAGANI